MLQNLTWSPHPPTSQSAKLNALSLHPSEGELLVVTAPALLPWKAGVPGWGRGVLPVNLSKVSDWCHWWSNWYW